MFKHLLLTSAVAALLAAQPNSQPNPYRTVEHWFTLPAGRTMGSTSSVFVAPNGHIWIAERCGVNTCAGSNLPPILEFDPSGKLLKSFGANLFVFPHSILMDKDGNLWLTDGQDKDGKGHQVLKLSQDGKVLMTLGKAGVAGRWSGHLQSAELRRHRSRWRHLCFRRSQRRTRQCARRQILQGREPSSSNGEDTARLPASLRCRIPSPSIRKGRLFVGDRGNNRIQIFDQEGKFLEEWKQFSRPSGIFIDKNDVIYVTDSESTDKEGYGHNPGWKRGIRVGSAKDGKVTAFIPDPSPGHRDYQRGGRRRRRRARQHLRRRSRTQRREEVRQEVSRSLLAQRGHRIDSRGPASRNPSCDQSHSQQCDKR